MDDQTLMMLRQWLAAGLRPQNQEQMSLPAMFDTIGGEAIGAMDPPNVQLARAMAAQQDWQQNNDPMSNEYSQPRGRGPTVDAAVRGQLSPNYHSNPILYGDPLKMGRLR